MKTKIAVLGLLLMVGGCAFTPEQQAFWREYRQRAHERDLARIYAEGQQQPQSHSFLSQNEPRTPIPLYEFTPTYTTPSRTYNYFHHIQDPPLGSQSNPVYVQPPLNSGRQYDSYGNAFPYK